MNQLVYLRARRKLGHDVAVAGWAHHVACLLVDFKSTHTFLILSSVEIHNFRATEEQEEKFIRYFFNANL